MVTHRDIQINQFNFALILLTAFALLLWSNLAVEAQKMYWADTRGIHRAERDGKNLETLVPVMLLLSEDIAVDTVERKIYWTEGVFENGKIRRANLDGTDIEDLVTGLDDPTHIAVDAVEEKIYWTEGKYEDSRIRRANLDGTNIENLVTTEVTWPVGIAVDAVGEKIYWTEEGSDTIQRANLDGTNIEVLVTTRKNNPRGIAVDAIERKIYWTEGAHCGMWAKSDGQTSMAQMLRMSSQDS